MTAKRMKLEELIKETDALTYLNTIKTQIQEVKDEFTQIEENVGYIVAGAERIKRVIRRIDNNYRAIVKCAQGQPTRNEAEVDPDMEALMENTG